jgi:hypothetical protein
MPKIQSMPEKFQNGWLSELDSRTSIAREMQERYQALTDDLGGVTALSYQQRSLVERSLWLEYWLVTQEKELAQQDGCFDVARWVQAANSLQGIYSKLGLSRVTREKSLNDIINNAVSESRK